MSLFPVVVTSAGAQPATPAALRAALTAGVAASNPDYTNNLPGSLIEDIASTDVYALVQIDSARVELLNSLTPYGANAFVLKQLGAMYGVMQGAETNTSVFLVFTGTPGFVVAKGFVVSDGTYQYIVQDGGIVSGAGVTSQLFAVAVLSGTWSVPAGTVTQLITSVPSMVTLSVNNPNPGIPSAAAQTEEEYRAAVLQAGLAAAQGMPTFLRTQLSRVEGVQARLVSPRQVVGGGWEIIVGGGDPYEVAYAIYRSLFDINNLVGSTMLISGITKANPGVATTELNHGLTTGDVIDISDSDPSAYDVTGATVTVISEKTFSYGVNTSGFATYVGSAVVTPNDRNITVTINDYPDSYDVIFVNPPQQAVTMTVTWNTTAPNFVSESAVSQLASEALADYINSIVVGQPINVDLMVTTFQAAISSVLPPAFLTRLVFSVAINGVGTAPSAGTVIVEGDPESYFATSSDQITVVKG